MSRGRWLAALVVLVAASVGGWFLLRPPPGFLTGMIPIDGERAVFTMRHNPENGASRAWIGVVGPDGVVWSRELPDLTPSIYARHGLTVADGRVTVMVSDARSYEQVLAFDLATGDDLWQGERLALQPSEYADMIPTVPGTRPIDDGTQLLYGDDDHQTSRIVARSSVDGTLQWAYELPNRGVQGMQVAPGIVALQREAGWTLLRREDGSVGRTIEAFGAACMDDTRFSMWTQEGLLDVDLDDPELPARTRPLPYEGIATRCGTYRGQLVFTLVMLAEARTHEIVGVDPDRAAIAWRIALEDWEPATIARQRDNAEPGADPLTGEMADFVPVVLDGSGDKGFQLAVLDLAEHEVAWRSPSSEELLYYDYFRGRGSQYFLTGNARIVAIDGDRGAITAAVEIPHEDARAIHAADGRLWVYSMEYGRLDRLPWAVLDGRTLEVVARGDHRGTGGDYAPADATDEVLDWLKPPSAARP